MLLRTLLALVPLAAPVAAQCPLDDAAEPNDGCATTLPLALGVTTGLRVTLTSNDWWSLVAPPGQVLDLTVDSPGFPGGVELLLYDDSGVCGTLVDTSQNFTTSQFVRYVNGSSNPVTLKLGVYFDAFFPGSPACVPYQVTATPTPDFCSTVTTDDSAEDNDSCTGASLLALGSSVGYFVKQSDEDYYRRTLAPGEDLLAWVNFDGFFANVDIQLLNGSDCFTVLDESVGQVASGEVVTYSNMTGAAIDVVLRVYIGAVTSNGCTDYDLTAMSNNNPCLVIPNDALEPNNDCASAVTVTPGTVSGLAALSSDIESDWFRLDVEAGATITVDLAFNPNSASLDAVLYSVPTLNACGGLTQVDSSLGNFNFQPVSATNPTQSLTTYYVEVFVNPFVTSGPCATYDLSIDVQGGATNALVPYCFGDGSGTPCPCGNDSSAGYGGGCASGVSPGALLSAVGVPSVSNDTLQFDLESGSPDSFALLVSGVNMLPQIGPCIGCGIPGFDGLRCAGGDLRRHGPRMIMSNGEVDRGWGPQSEPASGLVAASGFATGQVRHFFAFYRKPLAQDCGSGQGSSNGITVTVVP